MWKPIVCWDFDGVIHSYTTPWQGTTVIPDPPVEGIDKLLQSVKDAGYKNVVVSSRCATIEGLEAVKEYLKKYKLTKCIDSVQMEKPPALVYIDDRAICFRPDEMDTLLEKIKSFKPWNKQKT